MGFGNIVKKLTHSSNPSGQRTPKKPNVLQRPAVVARLDQPNTEIFVSLYKNVFDHVLSFLDLRSLARLSQTCRAVFWGVRGYEATVLNSVTPQNTPLTLKNVYQKILSQKQIQLKDLEILGTLLKRSNNFLQWKQEIVLAIDLVIAHFQKDTNWLDLETELFKLLNGYDVATLSDVVISLDFLLPYLTPKITDLFLFKIKNVMQLSMSIESYFLGLDILSHFSHCKLGHEYFNKQLNLFLKHQDLKELKKFFNLPGLTILAKWPDLTKDQFEKILKKINRNIDYFHDEKLADICIALSQPKNNLDESYVQTELKKIGFNAAVSHTPLLTL